MQTSKNLWANLTLLGGVNGLLAVAFGAFGAHSLQATLAANGRTEVYHTAAQYHLAHALALLVVASLSERLNAPKLVTAMGWLFAIGILLFSGSLYLLAVTNNAKLGAITPLGGLCFLTGWTLLIVAAWKEAR